VKDGDISLTCRQCGREFLFAKAEQEFYEQKGFAFPIRCQECRSMKQSQLQRLICSQCGTEIEKGLSIYCNACLASIHLEVELKTKQSKMAASAAHTKLLASESQKAELAEALRQKEKLIAELVTKLDSLSQELDNAQQFQAAVASLQPTLNSIEERLETLERAENIINERILKIAEKMHEMYENTGLLEIIKRSLRHYQRQGA
jgi:DNA repair exonuclease SbcCD ATPase subunit